LELAPAGYHHHATCFPSCRISPQLATAAAVRQAGSFRFGGGSPPPQRRLPRTPTSQQPRSAATVPHPPTRQPTRCATADLVVPVPVSATRRPTGL